jgi:plastocyanin
MVSAGLSLILGYLFYNGRPWYISYISAQEIGQNIPTIITIVQGSSSPTNGQFFVPSAPEVKLNTHISWRNNDTVLHIVTFAANNTAMPSFNSASNSGLIKPGEPSPEATFNRPGNFSYYCSIYPWMTGKIIVKS